MAHIKVVRRSMRPKEWTDLRFGWLKRHIYSKKWEINNLMIRDARQVSEMEFEYYSDDYRPLKKGDMYFTPDGTAFIRADVDIPKELRNEELYFSLKTAIAPLAGAAFLPVLPQWFPVSILHGQSLTLASSRNCPVRKEQSKYSSYS